MSGRAIARFSTSGSGGNGHMGHAELHLPFRPIPTAIVFFLAHIRRCPKCRARGAGRTCAKGDRLRNDALAKAARDGL